MNRPSRLDYAYAVGRVRVLEDRLISRAVFLQSVEAGRISGAFEVLFDEGSFQRELDEVHDSVELEAFLNGEGDHLRRELAGLAPEPGLLALVEEAERPERVLETAESFGYPFFVDYFRHGIDLGNLKVLARARYLNLPLDRFERFIHPGGFLEPRRWLQAAEWSWEDIGGSLAGTSLDRVWVDGIAALLKDNTFIDLERAIEDELTGRLRQAKYVTFGPEPLFAYALAKRRELSLMRLVGIGLLNRIPGDRLKRRIGETYV